MSGNAHGSSSSLTGTTLVSPFWSTMDGTEVERSSALFMFTFHERAARCRMRRQIPATNMAANDVTLASPQRMLSEGRRRNRSGAASQDIISRYACQANGCCVAKGCTHAKGFIYARKRNLLSFFFSFLQVKEIPET